MHRPRHASRRTPAHEPLERRLLMAIDVDPSFGIAGIAQVNTGIDDAYQGTVMVRETPGGTIVTVTNVGRSVDFGGTGIEPVMARFNADGTPDGTFGGGDGVSAIPIGTRAVDAVLQPDGKVVIVGQGSGTGTLLVARVTSGGALDATFAGDGVAEMTVASAANETFTAQGVALSPDGSIVASGSLRVGDDDGHAVIARFTSDGNPVTNFGGDGLVIENRPGFVDHAVVTVDANDRVFVAMREDDLAVVGRYTAAGVPDASFGGGGFAAFPQSRPGGDFPFSVTTAPDGVGVVVGAEGFIGWLDPLGELNASFAGDGTAGLPESVPFTDIVQEVVVDGDGRVAGVVTNGVLRLAADGSPDATFGTDGFVRVEDMATSAITVTAGDNNVLLVGGGFTGANAIVAVARIGQRPAVALGPTGVLVVTGSEIDDAVTLDVSGNQARLDVNGAVTTYALADVTAFDVDAGAGDNSVTLALDISATIRSAAGDDAIVTADGDDEIDAGDGANNLSTGAGADVITTGVGRDTIVTGDGGDTVRSSSGDDSITTGNGDDSIDSGFGGNRVVSNAGNDTVNGGEGADSIDAGAGDDRVLASFGNNTLAGGDGDDLLEGLDGRDSLTGGAGHDRLLGGNGDNALFGGTGNDYLRTGTGADTLWGEIGNDEMRAGDGDDYLNGGASKDRMFGQFGNDILYGGRNNDALEGGPGSDLLKGLDGIDKLFARDLTRDSLDGGAGSDLGVFDDPLDAVLRIETVL